MTDSTYEKVFMFAIPLTGNYLHKKEMEYYGKFGHTLGRIQHIAFMSRIHIFNAACNIETQTVEPNIPGFQGIKWCVQYLDSHPHKPIFYPYTSYYLSNVNIFTWIGNQVEDHTTQNVLECHQDVDHPININRRRSVSGILHTLLGVAV